MPHSALLKLTAVVMAAFGLALLLAPDTLMAVYKAPKLGASGAYNAMLYGALLLSAALINWMASAGDADQAKPVIYGDLLNSVLSLGVAVYRQVQPESLPSGWVNIGIFLVFTLLFAQLVFRGSAAQRPGGRGRVA